MEGTGLYLSESNTHLLSEAKVAPMNLSNVQGLQNPMCRTQDRADKQALVDSISSWGNEEGNIFF